jgi:hypothetical protein
MEKQKEALILLSKCGETHKTYGIRVEKIDKNNWLATWAFPIKENSAKREGYDKTSIKGNILFSEDYLGCPYCRRIGLTVCSCGHIGCTITHNNVYHCEWCGSNGTISNWTGNCIITAGMDA